MDDVRDKKHETQTLFIVKWQHVREQQEKKATALWLIAISVRPQVLPSHEMRLQKRPGCMIS